ncbi:hypothetical protein CS063_10385 [Sporanaerobium hydrogeniformans]|uniref:Uncharacterized protein n=1 Tax=Sporanaerobium hydrogeniformans TaxID=3072179 RepID=A0AC61DD59_9FIRM|nr:hypothetical protein [Sporanaerobium hydrogeniformans]PHV70487.1 hypothetical protein CS063_10385 [Sporanaerobium hydrogeniformans]
MSNKPRYFAIVSHCLLNPSTRVHMLGRRFAVAQKICDYLLSKNIAIIQLPCPEFTAMGYWRNPQGRQQYDNVFFRKHCLKELSPYMDMVEELTRNANTPLCYIGIQGSPTCSIYWGKHKTNRYKTESMEVDLKSPPIPPVYGVMTEVLNKALLEKEIQLPFLEAPVKESLESPIALNFFKQLEDLLHIPKAYHYPQEKETH